ncbi:MAG: hypothetical protein V5A56_00235 [Halolamina sp.]
MTDRINLDDIEQPDDDDKPGPNRGDWLWRGDGSPDEEPDEPDYNVDIGADDFAGDAAATPRIPRENDDKPVGVPVESGGAGGSAASSGDVPTGGVPPSAAEREAGESEDSGTDDESPSAAWSEAAEERGAATEAGEGPSPGSPSQTDADPAAASNASGSGHSRGEEWANAEPVKQSESTPGAASHGSGSSKKAEMTMAISYRAIRRLDNVHAALADAEGWTDYIGLVGDVDATVINKYQRDNVLDLDFFNGSGTGPAERLQAVGFNSMFYADRMVLVGVDEREQAWAQEADWEFVPLASAAANAGWEINDG